MNPTMNIDSEEKVEKWVCPGNLYFTKLEDCCPSVSLSDLLFTSRWFTDHDRGYVGVDFWSLFGRGKEVLECKLKELKSEQTMILQT